VNSGWARTSGTAAENAHKVHEARCYGGIRRTRETAGFGDGQHDTADEPDVCAGESGRQGNFQKREVYSRPGAVDVRAQPAGSRGDGEPRRQHEPRFRMNDQDGDKPDNDEHRQCHPSQRMAHFELSIPPEVREEARHQGNRCHLCEFENDNGQPENDDLAVVEESEGDHGMGSHGAPHQ
jgi:hypothetical protein